MTPTLLGTVELDGERLSIFRSRFDYNGRLGVFINGPLGEPYMTLSVNVTSEEMADGKDPELEENEIVVRLTDQEYNSALHVTLLQSGIFQDTGRRIRYGRNVEGAVWRVS